MYEMGVDEVTLIGGEAYLRDDWTQIAKGHHRLRDDVRHHLGWARLHQERARQAKEAGIRSVSVSIDGLRETH